MKNKYRILMWTFALVLAISCLPLQAGILNSVRGTITDSETGLPIPGVKIIMTAATLRYETVTDNKGFVYKAGLETATYEIRFEKDGYIPGISSFRLAISETRDISTQLKPLKQAPAPQQKVSLMKKGAELLNAGKFPDAINTLTEAIAETPTNPLLYYYRGFAVEKNGDLDKALEDFKKSLELDPEFLLSLSEAGKIYAKKKDFTTAITYYKKAYDMGTKDVLTLYNYGICLFNMGNNEEAQKVFEKIISINPNYPDAYYQLGIIYMGANDNAKAKEFLEKFVAMDPANENVPVAKEILSTL